MWFLIFLPKWISWFLLHGFCVELRNLKIYICKNFQFFAFWNWANDAGKNSYTEPFFSVRWWHLSYKLHPAKPDILYMCSRQIMRQLLDAVEFIHAKNIVHRDLKVCLNITITENSFPNVKIWRQRLFTLIGSLPATCITSHFGDFSV